LTERPVEREGLSEPRRHAVVEGPVPAPGYRPRRRCRRGKQAERREGRRVLGYVAHTLADVCRAGLVMVIGSNVSGVAWVAFADAGCSRYARLGAHYIGPSYSCPIPSAPSRLRLVAGRAVPCLFRSPGGHLHSLLRRSSVADRIGVGDSNR
jgi:hypothetical protein